MKISNIAVNGTSQTDLVKYDYSTENLILEQSFKVGQTERGKSKKTKIKLKEDQIIEFVFDDETRWISGPDTLDDIFSDKMFVSDRSSDDTFEIPTEISLDDEAERGLVKKVLLKVVNIFTKKVVEGQVKNLAEKLEDKQLDGKRGLFRLNSEMELEDFKPLDSDAPYLLFIHGTASNIKGSFGEIAGTELKKFMDETYKNRIIAFQHKTLTQNPLQNVLELVQALPKNCTLHLITSSRGGLIGEILSRFCNGNINNIGFTELELSILKKEYSESYYEELEGQIDKIKTVLQTKKIVIEKFIRVACPADGTTLASKRTDIFLNFLLNLVGIGTGAAVSPIYIAFKNLVSAVVDSKNDVDVLPGLEVQSPKSPFIKALNSIPDKNNLDKTLIIDNSLVIIAGNTKPAVKLSALLIIASKLFYRGKNDLIVNTESMSLGTRRSGRVQQFFYEGNDINHFKYFENNTTNSQIVRALKSKWGEKMPGFTEQYLNINADTERNALLKLDGGIVFKDDVSGVKPIVVLLPGIMGSNLSLDDSLVWINYWKFITGGLKKLKENNIEATSLVSTSYRKIVEFLLDDYDVVTFPFDWRLPLEESADKLNEKLKKLLIYNKPIKLIGHSMGGVLIRNFIIKYRKETWTKLNNSDGFRLIFLGAPLNGSFRIPSVLFGMDTITNKLDKIDLFHSEKELISIFSGFKGLLGLLPLTTDAENDFSDPKVWKNMVGGIGDSGWPVPSDKDLEWFKKYRDSILGGIQPDDFKNAVYIAGKDKATPCEYKVEKRNKRKELVFYSTSEGDQSVTWESGIPKTMIENNSVYYVDVSHGSLACEPDMFKGIKEIIESGSTGLFSKTKPMVRGEEKLFRSPEYRDFDLSEFGVEDTIMGRTTKTKLTRSEAAIRVSISQGDLFYSQFPILAGHFENDGILFAEKAVNGALNGMLNQQHQLGVYPGAIGTCELYITKQSSFKGAIIVGLGNPGNLTASELTKTVEQGVAYYLLRMVNCNLFSDQTKKDNEKIGISSLIIGSGYGGLPINTSIKAIIQGVHNANVKVRNLKLENTRIIEHIEFIEKFKEKAISSLFSISSIAEEEANNFKILMEDKGIKTLLGASESIPTETSEGWWSRVSIDVKENEKDKTIKSLEFSVSTNSSREEKHELHSTPVLMESIIKEMATKNDWTPESAKTIFELMIPNGFKEQLKKHGNINWIVDEYSASYPWELLQESVADAKPLCVSSGMIRQLKTSNYRTMIKSVPKNNALIVADPELNGFINQLPGALKEGQMVVDELSAQGMNITKSLRGNHTEIIKKLFSEDYKIIHLSGHGIFNEDVSKGSGMVIGDGLFLSTREINQMSTVPELVFVNCCHLGAADGGAEELYQKRYKLASNIGTQLIKNGVKCVVAAGWAVNDNAALEFAEIFYQRMFSGYNFGDAVKDARNHIFYKFNNTNTWGAYQCYGDPFYTFDHLKRSIVNKKAGKKKYLISQQAEIELSNLLSEVDIGKWPTEDYLEELNTISSAVDEWEVRNAKITEREALVYFELKDYDKACEKFGELLKVEDASFSFSVAEKYCNARAKKIVHDYKENQNFENNIKFLNEIDKVISDLETLNKLSPTSERYNILASTYKRKALIHSVESDIENKRKAYEMVVKNYQNGYANLSNWYSLTNWLIFESIFVLSGKHKWNSKKKTDSNEIPSKENALEMLEMNKSKLVQNTDQMSYWDMLGGINIRLCSYIVQFSDSKTKPNLDIIFKDISDIWKIAGSKGKRFAEIEHLEFIIDALKMAENFSQTRKSKITQLKDEIENLKMELNKLI